MHRVLAAHGTVLCTVVLRIALSYAKYSWLVYRVVGSHGMHC